MSADKDIPKELPYFPQSQSHLVNWEVLKRLTTGPAFDGPAAHKRLFIDDAPYDKYIEDSKEQVQVLKPVPEPLPKETLPSTYTTFTSRTVPWLWSCLGRSTSTSAPASSSQSSQTIDYACQLGSSGAPSSALAHAKLGVNARHKNLAFSLLTSSVSFSSSSPASLQASSGVLATLAYKVNPDTTAALTFDLVRSAPQASIVFSGDTGDKDAHLYAHYDHGTKATTVGGLVEFAGHDWRPVEVAGTEHGGRHRLWCEQEICAGKTRCTSKIGGSIDVNHALNWLAWCWADVLEASALSWTVPIWGMLPGGVKLRELIMPAPHPEDWMRYHIRGLQVDAVHDFNSGKAIDELSVSKRLASGHTLRGFYRSEGDKVGAEWQQRHGLVLGVTADRQGIQDFCQPLNLNCFVGMKGSV